MRSPPQRRMENGPGARGTVRAGHWIISGNMHWSSSNQKSRMVRQLTPYCTRLIKRSSGKTHVEDGIPSHVFVLSGNADGSKILLIKTSKTTTFY